VRYVALRQIAGKAENPGKNRANTILLASAFRIAVRKGCLYNARAQKKARLTDRKIERHTPPELRCKWRF
jgi:hypothetical protein